MDVAASALVRRLSGRWSCKSCGAPYNLTSKPPKVAGICDICGGELYQRDDDKEAAINNRIGAPENVRLMKRLLAEESNARQSGAGDSWTFAFYVNDATAEGYSANMGGLSKVRQHLLKQCKAASQGRQAGAPTQPN